MGLAFAGFFGGAALSTALLGRLADKLGSRTAIRVGVIISTLTLLSVGGLVNSASTLVLVLVLAGCGNALIEPAVNRYLLEAVVSKNQGIVFGIKHAAIPLATFVAGMAVPVVAVPLGWRMTYLCGGGASLCLLGTLHLFPNARSPVVGSLLVKRPSPSAALVALAACMWLAGGAASALVAFAVSSGLELGLSISSASTLFAISSGVGLLVRLVVGRIIDRRTSLAIPLMGSMMAIGALAFASMGMGNQVLFMGALPVAFAAGWGWVGIFSLVVVRLRPEAPGTATGVVLTGGYLGGVMGPLLFAGMASWYSHSAAWLLAATWLVGSALLVLITPRLA